jgi:Mor family transcriptional regulator
VLAHELNKNDVESESLSFKLSLAIGNHLGGMQFYLPRGDALVRYIRDMEIWDSFNGRNTKELAHKHHLTEKSIYEILARMRKIEQKRRQPDLFI